MVGDNFSTGKSSNPEHAITDILVRDYNYYMSIITPQEYMLASAESVGQDGEVLASDALRSFLFAIIAELLIGLDLTALHLQRRGKFSFPS